MSSQKTAVIEYLFDLNWDASNRRLRKTVMSLDDVAGAIRVCNAVDGIKRSDNNSANFLKDVIRSKSASKIWPAKVSDAGYFGEQRTGSGDCFEFVPFSPGQTEPFPDLFRPSDSTKMIDIQSVSMPLASKKLGRSDEAWLIQTAVNLRVIEQHLAAVSLVDVLEITHLQMNVKLRATEIDALYLATIRSGGSVKQAIITCEAKKGSERILVGQIANQIQSAFETTDAPAVIPIAIRSIKNIGIHVIEFEMVERLNLDFFLQTQAPTFSSDAIYRFVPPVTGI